MKGRVHSKRRVKTSPVRVGCLRSLQVRGIYPSQLWEPALMKHNSQFWQMRIEMETVPYTITATGNAGHQVKNPTQDIWGRYEYDSEKHWEENWLKRKWLANKTGYKTVCTIWYHFDDTTNGLKCTHRKMFRRKHSSVRVEVKKEGEFPS